VGFKFVKLKIELQKCLNSAEHALHKRCKNLCYLHIANQLINIGLFSTAFTFCISFYIRWIAYIQIIVNIQFEVVETRFETVETRLIASLPPGGLFTFKLFVITQFAIVETRLIASLPPCGPTANFFRMIWDMFSVLFELKWYL
jgi:hypothetical protein